MKNKIITCLLPVLIIAAAITVFLSKSGKTEQRDVGRAEDGLILSITAYGGEGSLFVRDLGHVWLAVGNGLDKTVSICGYEAEPGKTVTFSVWAINRHCGAVFNLEPKLIYFEKKYSDRKTLSFGITESDLKTIENYIFQNDRWTPTYNCSKWSVTLWNTVVSDEYRLDTGSPICTPSLLKKTIEEFSCVETDADFSSAGQTFFIRDGKITGVELCH